MRRPLLVAALLGSLDAAWQPLSPVGLRSPPPLRSCRQRHAFCSAAAGKQRRGAGRGASKGERGAGRSASKGERGASRSATKGERGAGRGESPGGPALDIFEQHDETCNVVLTHVNADFDSLASAVGCAKLWSIQRPQFPTFVVMPRGANPVASRFLGYHKHLLPIRGFSTVSPSDIRSIGVCDTQTSERLGPAAAWLSNAQHVTVYDHHEFANSDLSPDELVVEAVGSVTTILVEKLMGLADHTDGKLTEAEATLFALGIRADTGSLTYPCTTPRDGRALVWLMENGASQTSISEFGHARLSEPQRQFLADALHGVDLTLHRGLKLGVVYIHTGRGFVTGMARVAEELMELGTYDVLLMGVVHVNAKSQRFLSLIGRASSRARNIDLSLVLRGWDGGGHPMAAAASVRLPDPDPDELEARVAWEGAGGAHPADEEAARGILDQAMSQIREQVPEQVTAADIMTHASAISSVSSTDTMAHAYALMRRIDRKGAPVVDNGTFAGTLKFRDVVKAHKGKKSSQLVKAWMRRGVLTVPPSMTFDALEDFCVTQSIGCAPASRARAHGPSPAPRSASPPRADPG